MKLWLFAMVITAPGFAYDFSGAIPSLPWDTAGRIVYYVTSQEELDSAMNRQESNVTIILRSDTIRFTHFDTISQRTMVNCENITIRGETEDPSAVVLYGPGYLDTTRCEGGELCAGNAIKFRNCKNITLAYFTLVEWGWNGLQFEGDSNDNFLIHGVHGLNIRERHVKGSGGHYDNVEVRYCAFSNTKTPPLDYPPYQDGDYTGGMDIMGAHHWNIHDNYFKDIKGAGGGGRGAIFIWNASVDITAQRNAIAGCDRGICFGNSSNGNPAIPHVDSGLICNNFIVDGPFNAIELGYANHAMVYNNTIATSASSDGRKIRIDAGDRAEIKNNIVLGWDVQLGAGAVYPDTSKNIQSGLSPANFVNLNIGDLHLSSSLPAVVDRGLTLDGISDDFDAGPRFAPYDIGADEWDNTTFPEKREHSINAISIECSPNPFNPDVLISIVCAGSNHAPSLLRIYAPNGQCVTDLTSKIRNGTVSWNASEHSSGIYIVRIALANTVVTKAVTLLK